MRAQIPNLLTVLRLVLAVVFFVVLNVYRFPAGPAWALWTALVLFVVAALTDALDGYLARRWRVESGFGRVMDPVVDKVLVLGAFMYLAGPRFALPEAAGQVSGVYPWMVVVMLVREMLVTSGRSLMEGGGTRFGALPLGKAKMILQCVAVPVVLAIVWLDPTAPGQRWAAILRDVLVYVTVVVTLLSGLPYLWRARTLLRNPATR